MAVVAAMIAFASCGNNTKKAEEKAIKLKEFREKVMAGEADLPADEGFI